MDSECIGATVALYAGKVNVPLHLSFISIEAVSLPTLLGGPPAIEPRRRQGVRTSVPQAIERSEWEAQEHAA